MKDDVSQRRKAEEVIVDSLMTEELLREAIIRITFYHHDDYDYCFACEKAVNLLGLGKAKRNVRSRK